MTIEGDKPQHIDNRSKLEILQDIERETERLLEEFARSMDLAHQQAAEQGLPLTDENLDESVGSMTAGDVIARLANLDMLAASFTEVDAQPDNTNSSEDES